jgi:hypothetical protein
MINFIVPAGHDGLAEYLGLWGRDVAARFRTVYTRDFTNLTRFPRGTYVLAAIDQYPPGVHAFVTAVHAALDGQAGIRFLNHPTQTLQRFGLLDTLYRTGRNAYRAVRVSSAWQELRFPLFVRDESNHDGALSPLLHGPAEVERAIGDAIVRGHHVRDLMVVEFCDTSDATGLYRKYSAFVVGHHVIPRYLSVSQEWMLKFAGGEFTRAMAEEELEYLMTNPHEAELREIFDVAKVGYGRIDYGMKDGRLQTWEINLNPTIGRGLRQSSGRVPPDVDAVRTPGKEQFYRRFREAWEDVDLAVAEEPAFAPAIDTDVVRAARESDADDRWMSTLRRVLRPAKPLIAPVVDAALPLIGRAALRRRSE